MEAHCKPSLRVLLFCIMMLVSPTLCRAQDIRLIVRGDDFGMTPGSVIAFEKAFMQGVLTCASLLVQPPSFAAAADLAGKNPRWCIGVHLSLVGEWRGMDWRPVLPRDRVSSLVDEDGFLYKDPRDLFRRHPKIAEIDSELRSQIDLARKNGVEPRYLDTHYMGLDDYPGLRNVIEKIGRDYRLPISSQMGEKRTGGIYRIPIERKKAEALKMLEGLKPGLWLWVCHIGIDSPEQDTLVHADANEGFPGGVNRHRASELEVLTSPEVKSVINRKGIILSDYRELAKERAQADSGRRSKNR